MQEKIIFEIKTNLDQIAKTVNQLSKDVDKFSKLFLKNNILLKKQNQLERKSIRNLNKMSSAYGSVVKNTNLLNKNKKQLITNDTKREQDVDISSKSINNLKDNFSNFKSEESGEKIRNVMGGLNTFSNSIINNILKTLDKIHNIGMSLAEESFNLKPFVMDFMNSFSFNPLKFFGFGQAMKESFQLIQYFQQMRHEMAYLSDASGDASKAINLIYSIAGNSAVASGTARTITKNLVDEGITSQKRIKEIGVLSGNLQAATGISGSQWAKFTGEIAFSFNVEIKGLENITSALVGTDLRGAQLEKAMLSVGKILQSTGFIAGKPTTDSLLRLTKSIGGSIKIFQALGISAEKATAFVDGLLNVDNFEKNAFLLGELGISASDYAEYLNDVDGQKKLLDDTMENLPRLATKIISIQNPYARIQYAKQLGLDMQIVRQIAGKTKGQVRDILARYEEQNKANEALEAKKKYMAAEAAKFDDMMMALRLKILAPIIKFLTKGKGLSNFISVLPTIAITVGRMFEALVPIIKVMTDVFNALVPVFKDVVQRFVAPFISAFPNMLKRLMEKYLPFFNYKPIQDSKNKSPTEQLFIGFKSFLGYLTKIYFFVLGWKAISFAFDLVNNIYEFFVPKSKKLFDTPFNTYLKEMDNMYKNKKSGGILSNLGFGTKIAIGLISFLTASFIAKWIKKTVFPPDFAKMRKERFKKRKYTKEQIKDEKLKSFLEEQLKRKSLVLLIPKRFGGPGLKKLNKLFYNSTFSQNNKLVYDILKKVFNKKEISKLVKNLFSKTNFINAIKSPIKTINNLYQKTFKSFSNSIKNQIELIKKVNYSRFLATEKLIKRTNVPLQIYIPNKMQPLLKGAIFTGKKAFSNQGALGKLGTALSLYGLLTGSTPEEFWGRVAGIGGGLFLSSQVAAYMASFTPGNPFAKIAVGIIAFFGVGYVSEYLGYNVASWLNLNKDIVSLSRIISNNIERGISGIARAITNRDFESLGEYSKITLRSLVNSVLEYIKENSYLGSILIGRNLMTEPTKLFMQAFAKDENDLNKALIKKYEGKIVADNVKNIAKDQIRLKDFNEEINIRKAELDVKITNLLHTKGALNEYFKKHNILQNMTKEIKITEENKKFLKNNDFYYKTLANESMRGSYEVELNNVREQLSNSNISSIFKDTVLLDLLDLSSELTKTLKQNKIKEKEFQDKDNKIIEDRFNATKQTRDSISTILSKTIESGDSVTISSKSF